MDFLKSFKFVSLFLLMSVLASCGGSGGDNSSAVTSQTGRVSLLITDGVTDDFDEVNLTVTSISFLGNDDGHETIVFDESRVINLLALQNYSDVLVTAVIPAGIYDKIRLRVTKVELVKEGQAPIVTKLPANGKVDLNPRGTFEVIAGGHLMIELDMDMEKSIKVTRKGNGEFSYNFRPVVFVNILGVGEEESKLVLLDGIVLDRSETGFRLCKGNDDVHHDDDDGDEKHDDDDGDKKHEDDDGDEKHDDDDDERHDDDDDGDEHQDDDKNDNCIVVSISENTVVQDDLIEVVAADNVDNGDSVTVLGKAGGHKIDALHIVIEAADKSVSDLALFNGAATSDFDVDNFTMNASKNGDVVIQPVSLAGLTVALVEGSGVRVFDKNGSEVSADSIVVGTDVDVFGLAQPDISSVNKVKAAFIIIDNGVKADKISGVIAAINGVDSEITVMVVNDVFSGDVCVDIKDAVIFILTIADGKVVSKEITINELQVDMRIDAYGQDDGLSCVTADVVLVSEPLAVIQSGATLLVTGD